MNSDVQRAEPNCSKQEHVANPMVGRVRARQKRLRAIHRASAAITLSGLLILPAPAVAAASVAADGSAIRRFRTDTTRTANLPFSDAVWTGSTLYLNSQIGNVPGQGAVVTGGLDAEFFQAMHNIDAVLRANGLTRSNLVMCTVALSDIGSWPALNRLWRAAFDTADLPARNVVSVEGLPLHAAVGIQCIGARG